MSGESNFFINTVDYFDIDVGSFASPFLVDLDRDDDLDLIIGTRHGNIYHYENQGSINNAEFILVNDLFGSINLTDPIYNTAYTTPMVIDGDNGFELYVGTEKGSIHHYNNIDDNLEGTFTEVNDSVLLYSNGIRTAPYIFDLNNDGWNDMLLGVYTGGVHLLWGCDYNQVSTPEKENILFKIYPNPTKGILHLENFDAISQLNVYSLGGRLCYTATPKQIIDLSNLEPGLYFIQSITTNGDIQTTKICIQ